MLSPDILKNIAVKQILNSSYFKWISFCLLVLFLPSCKQQNNKESTVQIVNNFEKPRIAHLVEQYWDLKPTTVTDSVCPRSAGGIHDFYSEGDYWWPDPQNPDGPYIRKDGLSNPGNFKAHRRAMVRLSRIVGAMTSEWLLTGDEKYAQKAMDHLRAWFVDSTTRMNPNLLYAQAIKGRYTGRGIGIIDALHLVEVARSAYLLQNAPGVSPKEIKLVKDWFASFLNWMCTHQYGHDEMVHPNNHGTCWALQAAGYAQLTDNDSILAFCHERYENTLLPHQMSTDGSFPLELERTKPYGYSLFNLDAMSMLVQILSTSGYDKEWGFKTTDGRGIKKGIEFMFPYIKDKSKWPYHRDVMYWDYWPVSQPALVLCGVAFSKKEYIQLWKRLDHDPTVEEIQRNMVMRYPLLWLDIEK